MHHFKYNLNFVYGWLYFCLTAHLIAGLESLHLAFANDSKSIRRKTDFLMKFHTSLPNTTVLSQSLFFIQNPDGSMIYIRHESKVQREKHHLLLHLSDYLCIRHWQMHAEAKTCAWNKSLASTKSRLLEYCKCRLMSSS